MNSGESALESSEEREGRVERRVTAHVRDFAWIQARISPNIRLELRRAELPAIHRGDSLYHLYCDWEQVDAVVLTGSHRWLSTTNAVRHRTWVNACKRRPRVLERTQGQCASIGWHRPKSRPREAVRAGCSICAIGRPARASGRASVTGSRTHANERSGGKSTCERMPRSLSLTGIGTRCKEKVVGRQFGTC